MLAPLALLVCACADPGQAALDEGNRLAAQGLWVDARASFERAASAAKLPGRARLQLGNALLMLDAGTDAQAAFEKVLAAAPDSLDAELGLARVDLSLGKANDAIARLDRVMPRAGRRADLPTLRALALLARADPGDFERALTDTTQAVSAEPRDLSALYLRGSAQLALSKYADAQSTFDTLERLQPKSPVPAWGLARLAAAQGRRADVILHLRTAVARGAATSDLARDPAWAFLASDPDFRREFPPAP